MAWIRPDNANLIVGSGELYVDAGFASAGWSSVGGFRDGLSISITPTRENIQGFDQTLGTARSVRTNIEVTISTQLTEATAQNLRWAAGINDTFTVAASNATWLGFSNIESPTAVLFVGEDDNGDLKTWIFSETYPQGTIEIGYQRDSEVRIPFEMQVIGVTVAGTPHATGHSTIFGWSVSASDTTPNTGGA